MVINGMIKECLLAMAKDRFIGKEIFPMENGFQFYNASLPEDDDQQFFFMMYFHIPNDNSTHVVQIRVEVDKYKRFVWDNEFYRNKIAVYLANDPRNWPDAPILRVFNIYNGRKGFIHSLCDKKFVVYFEKPKSIIAQCELDNNMQYPTLVSLIAHGWRCIEDCQRKGESKVWTGCHSQLEFLPAQT